MSGLQLRIYFSSILLLKATHGSLLHLNTNTYRHAIGFPFNLCFHHTYSFFSFILVFLLFLYTFLHFPFSLSSSQQSIDFYIILLVSLFSKTSLIYSDDERSRSFISSGNANDLFLTLFAFSIPLKRSFPQKFLHSVNNAGPPLRSLSHSLSNSCSLSLCLVFCISLSFSCYTILHHGKYVFQS